MSGIVTIIKDSEDIHFILEKPSNAKRLGCQKFPQNSENFEACENFQFSRLQIKDLQTSKIEDFESVEFLSEWKCDKVIILTNEGWYSINDKNARFMELLR